MGEKIKEEKVDLKVKSFRISDETAEAFKKVAESLGSNQQETMARLLDTYELQAQQQRTEYAEHKEDIEKFQKHMGVITNLYLRSLEESIYASDTIGAQFENELRSKDDLIEELRQEISVVKKALDKKTAEEQALRSEYETCKNQAAKIGHQLEEEIRFSRRRISERDDIIAQQSKRLIAFEAKEQEQLKQLEMLSEQVKETTDLRNENAELSQNLSAVKEQLAVCSEKLATATGEIDTLKKQIENEKSRNEVLISETRLTAAAAEKEKYDVQLRLIKAEYEAEIAKLKTAHMEQLMSLQTATDPQEK